MWPRRASMPSRLKALADQRRVDAAAHHAGVLREAAHDGGLEGPHQRSGSRRLLSHRERHSAARASCCCTSPSSGCPRAPRRSIPSCRSTCPSSSPGPRSGRAPPNRKPTAKWPAACRRRSASRTARTVRSSTSINALQSVRHPHHFLGITQQGQSAVFRTRGNTHAHLVLRGGGGRVNYDAVSIAVAERELTRGRICRPISWSIAVTAIPTRTRACSRWLRKTVSCRSSTAIARSSVSCWKVT